MADDISKLCSDFLRECYPGLKASHAHELVAAFFGYKSHAALLADKNCSVEFLDIAAVIVPAVDMIQDRRTCLKGLLDNVSASDDLAIEIVEFLQREELFTGEVWNSEDLGQFMMEEYLPEHLSPDLDIELEDVIAETNAFFDEISYDIAKVEEARNSVTIIVSGAYAGASDHDEMFCGDTIDMEIVVHLPRMAGLVAYAEPEIEVTGSVNRDYCDTEKPEKQAVPS